MAEETHSHGHRDDHDDEGVLQSTQEDGVGKQFFVVCQTYKHVGTVHGGIKEAGHHAEDHGVDDEAQEENQAGQQEAVGGECFTPDQGAAALWLLDRCFCSQENHQSFRLQRFLQTKPLPRRDLRGRGSFRSDNGNSGCRVLMPQRLRQRWRSPRRWQQQSRRPRRCPHAAACSTIRYGQLPSPE